MVERDPKKYILRIRSTDQSVRGCGTNEARTLYLFWDRLCTPAGRFDDIGQGFDNAGVASKRIGS